jgi:hypothetical protein
MTSAKAAKATESIAQKTPRNVMRARSTGLSEPSRRELRRTPAFLLKSAWAAKSPSREREHRHRSSTSACGGRETIRVRPPRDAADGLNRRPLSHPQAASLPPLPFRLNARSTVRAAAAPFRISSRPWPRHVGDDSRFNCPIHAAFADSERGRGGTGEEQAPELRDGFAQ